MVRDASFITTRALAAAATAGLGVLAVLAATETTAAKRLAIRVSCADAAVCTRAEAIAEDVWSEEQGAGLPLDLVVREDRLPELARAGVAYEVLVPDIDAVARAEQARLHSPSAASAEFFAEFRDYRAITERLQSLAELAPERAQVQPIGSSLDGRTIWAIHIGGGGAGKTPMMINGTQHAREWIAAMTATCVADRLVRGYGTDPEITDFVDHTDLWLVPVANPDGYQYSWASDRYWRKNRRDGHGVDLNRNFGIAFGGAGSSGWKRSEVYHGAFAFSEPESAALRDLAKRVQPALHVDFHAYGQLILYPWGYTSKRTDDHAKFGALGDRIASAMFAQHDTRYRLIQSVELYPAAGTMTDWMYADAHALSYTIELRPRGGSGFVLPPDQIAPTCDEGLAAVLALRKGL